MSTDTGPNEVVPDLRAQLMDVTMDVSRAHLLLSGTLDWVPRTVRPHTDEAMRILEDSLRELRDIAVALHEEHHRAGDDLSPP
ncbi:hypothetical protein ACT8ZV_04475 [Nocardioides sp. MAHUQ-72]|uniref:hypothetical protein n=1 Tax=unclassified Nocardioides TaxID=2615069 RepID=UPI003613148C